MLEIIQGRRKQSADGQAQLDVVKLPIICAWSMLQTFGPIFSCQEALSFHFSFKLELPLLCSLSLVCTERMCAHLRLYPAEFYYSSSVWEQDYTKVEHIISYVLTSTENGQAMAGPAGLVPVPM